MSASRRRAALALAVLALLVVLGAVRSSLLRTEHQLENVSVQRDGGRSALAFTLLSPSAWHRPAHSPLLVYLHGAGASSRDANLLTPAFAKLRARLFERGYFILLPELGPSHFMNHAAVAQLDHVLDYVVARYRLDHNRVHLMGTSMGAGGALAYAIQGKHRVRSVCSHLGMTDFRQWYDEQPQWRHTLSIAYAGTPQTNALAYRRGSAMDHIDALLSIPVFLLYADDDTTVGVQHGDQLQRALTEKGGQVILRKAHGMGHSNDSIIGFEDELMRFFEDATLARASSTAR